MLRSLEEPETLDVLGLGAVRDAFSEMLSPGTSTIQTRLRYFIFLPWIFARLEVERVPQAEFARRLRQDEARLILRHSIDGNLQAVLDEHGHVLRDWLGYLSLTDDDRRREAADDIAGKVAEALELRTSSYRVDIPSRQRDGHDIEFQPHRMRTRFAVAFGHQTLDEGGEVRIESVSRAFNSPFWPFVLTSTSIGQEGLDFHLWCHAVVHWNLPSNPVDLEQREGRVHRYKGHATRGPWSGGGSPQPGELTDF